MRFLPNLGTKDSFSTWTMPEGEMERCRRTLDIIIVKLHIVVSFPCHMFRSGLGSTLKMRCPSWLPCLSAACECNVSVCGFYNGDLVSFLKKK